MNVHISKIDIYEKGYLERLLKKYLSEFNQNLEYPYLDSYWKDKNRIPLKLTLDNTWLGFALINDFTIINSNEISIAEFYIQPEYRKQGYGHLFANYIFDNYYGKWEVSHDIDNITASKFWTKLITKHTRGELQLTEIENKIILSFNS